MSVVQAFCTWRPVSVCLSPLPYPFVFASATVHVPLLLCFPLSVALATRREGVFNMTLRELMTPAGDLLFATPDMTLTQCSVMMTERKVRNLPVIVDNSVKGLITLRHLSWAAHRAVLGLKDTAMQSMKVRGISPDVSVALAAVEAPRRVKLIAGAAFCPRWELSGTAPPHARCLCVCVFVYLCVLGGGVQAWLKRPTPLSGTP